MTTKTVEQFMQALDAHQPDWWIVRAHQQDLKDFVRLVHVDPTSLDRATESLRRCTAQDLLAPVRACVHAGLVTPVEGF